MERKFRKVLIVEDDLTQVPLWKHIISRISNSASIEWAVSSEQAKTIIQSAEVENKKFDLIIVDLFLAGSSTGLELLQSKVVEESGADTILVSAVSKKNLEENIKTLLKKTKILAKPLSIVKCEKVINELRVNGV